MVAAAAVLGGVMVTGLWPATVSQADASGQAGASLAECMQQLEQHFRQLRRQVRDESRNAETIELLSKMQLITLQAKDMKPDLSTVSEDQRPAHLQDYRLRMVHVAGAMLQAEAALIEARNEDAFELVKVIQTMRTEGHQEFRIDD